MTRILPSERVSLQHTISRTSYDATTTGDWLAGQRRTREVRQSLAMYPALLTRPAKDSIVHTLSCRAPGCRQPEHEIRIKSIDKTKNARLRLGLYAFACLAGLVALPILIVQLHIKMSEPSVDITTQECIVFFLGLSLLALSCNLLVQSVRYQGIEFVDYKHSEGHSLGFLQADNTFTSEN